VANEKEITFIDCPFCGAVLSSDSKMQNRNFNIKNDKLEPENIRKEADLVRVIDEYLELNGCISFPQNSDVRHGRKNSRYKAGTPDIIFMNNNGYFYGVECKKRSRMSNSQIAMQQKFIDKKQEFRYILVTMKNWKERLDEVI
jgi:hypothetical protein